MIKFFRHIRKRLLSENRFSKYLIYALGEIVLVVIGILIALQINNWNEEGKELNAFYTQLALMVTELEEDISFYNSMMESNRVNITFLSALSSTNYDSLDLTKTVPHISHNYDPRRFGTAYAVLKESGRLQVLDGDSLRKTMVKYFEERCVRFNNISSWHKSFVGTNIEPYIMQNLLMDEYARTDSLTVIQKMGDPELQNIVNIQRWNHERFDRVAESGVKAAEELIAQIEKELQKSEL